MLRGRTVINRSIAAAALAGVIGGGLAGCMPGGPDVAGVPDDIDYNWHVRPILSENCFQCHGPDAQAREASLRLDVGELAVGRLEGPRERYAIVPGDPDDSELIWRISTDSSEDVMPPTETGKTLTETEKAILRQWIDEGAEYRPHWAFIPPEAVVPPTVEREDRAVNAIDRFVLRRLELAEMNPSPEADRETLINRLSLTLTGLPPTLADVDAFVADTNPDAYERLVDRLLASPRYAEHMAAYWMDLARFSESDGFLDDHHDRTLWPWRDWVIDAFAANMPFDEFGTWQLAGDLLPNATREQILATAYLRVGKRTTENGAIEEEYKAEYMIERTDNALGTAFMGLTLGCARCHDHKYDPISQRDYYSLGAFFNSNDEPGVYAPGFSGIQGGPTLPWPDADMQAEIDRLAREIGLAERAFADALDGAMIAAGSVAVTLVGRSPRAIAAALAASTDAALAAHYPLDAARPAALEELPPPRAPNDPPRSIVTVERFPYGRPPAEPDPDETPGERRRREQERLLAGVPRNYVQAELTLSPASTPGISDAVIQAPIFGPGVSGQALYFDETNKGFLGAEVGWYDNQDPFSLDLWFYTADTYDKVPIINHRAEQNAGYTGYSLEIEDGHLKLRLAHSPPANMIALRSIEPLRVGEWSHLAFSYDGSGRAAGTRLYLDGRPMPTEVVRDTLTRTFLPFSSGNVFEQFVGLAFGTRFRAKAPVGSALDEVRVFDKALTPLEVAYLHDPDAAVSRPDLTLELTDLLVREDKQVAERLEALRRARGAHNRAVSAVPQVLVMRDAPEPIPTYVLERGLYNAPGERVEPRGMDIVFPWDPGLPANRLGLAQWLFDDDNPLTARVFVNRIWQMHFGRGLVETAEDFGSQGAIPSHPELLDWLTSEFVASGWDVKGLHKLIVMSATYRQGSAASDELLQLDAQNELLARAPRWRMTAEMVRDAALAVSGLLTEDIGGKSVTPYQPDEIWNTTNSFYRYPSAADVPEDDHHRRTLYSFVKRNALHPMLTVFDFTNRTESQARRRSSNTPLQALTLLNDPQFVEAYRELASTVLRRGNGDRDAELARLYRMATRATPSAQHVAVLREYFAAEREIFAANAAKREQLLSAGVTEADASLDATDLAAMTLTAALVMNSPDAYTVR